MKQELKLRGIDPDGLTADRRLTIINSEDIYVPNGRADVDGIFRRFYEVALAYRRRGFDGVRAAADVSPLIRRGLVRELGLYERSLGQSFSFPARGSASTTCSRSRIQGTSTSSCPSSWCTARCS